MPRIGPTLILLVAGCLLMASGHSAVVALPPIPPLPAEGWPAPEVAEPFAAALMKQVTPAELDDATAANPALLPLLFRNLGTALLSRDETLRKTLMTYAIELVHVHGSRIRADFSADELRTLITFQVLDPLRYGEDDGYRAAVNMMLPDSLSSSLPERLRRAAVNELNRFALINFPTSELLASNANLLMRTSASRFIDRTEAGARVTSTGNDPIEASIYSINSRFVAPEEARRFLAAVRRSAPDRAIVLIADEVLHSALAADVAASRITFVDNLSRPLSLWPRDPFSVAYAPSGGVVFINRPNQQHNREEDASMIRVLVDGLPAKLDKKWNTRWTTGNTPFHNGQVLLTPEAAWISMHSVEARALELSGHARMPVDDFGTSQGVASYVNSVKQASEELSSLYGRPVRFIHALPKDLQQVATLAGGAGFDLDSIVTILPRKTSATVALVADIRLGTTLAIDAPSDDWAALEKTYSLRKGSRQVVVAFQRSPVASGLQYFLDRAAEDLATARVKVQRIPLIIMPAAVLTNADDAADTPYFLLTWNNVVLERSRAEGFASGLATGDAVARAAYQAAGYKLTLFPPLARSVVLNGGYRCASNEVRRAETRPHR